MFKFSIFDDMRAPYLSFFKRKALVIFIIFISRQNHQFEGGKFRPYRFKPDGLVLHMEYSSSSVRRNGCGQKVHLHEHFILFNKVTFW